MHDFMMSSASQCQIVLFLTENEARREPLHPGGPAERRHVQRLRDHPPLRLLRRRRGRARPRGRPRRRAPAIAVAPSSSDVVRSGWDLLGVPAGSASEHRLEFVHDL